MKILFVALHALAVGFLVLVRSADQQVFGDGDSAEFAVASPARCQRRQS